jgi:hypothetical protein
MEFTAKMLVEDSFAKVPLLFFNWGYSVKLIRSLTITPID